MGRDRSAKRQFFGQAPPRDVDGDAIPDAAEVHGVDDDGNGSVDVDLPAMGADYEHKDLFVEVDAMDGRRLENAALAEVVSSYGRAPVDNLDRTGGIDLHVDNGPRSVMDPARGRRWGDLSDADTIGWRRRFVQSGEPWTAFDKVKASHFDSARRPYFRYALSVHEISKEQTAAGWARGAARPEKSSNFILALGSLCPGGMARCPLTTAEAAGVFMHELGHTLGLGHGGPSDDVNRKPNHLSVMNYFFVLSGLLSTTGGSVFDYARATGIPDINEKALTEQSGLQAPGGLPFITLRFCPDTSGPSLPTAFNTALDLDCDQQVEPGTVPGSLNGDDVAETLSSRPEWDALHFQGGEVGAAGPSAPAEMAVGRPEASVKQWLAYSAALRRDRRRPRVRLTLKRRSGRHIVRAVAQDDRGLDRLVVRIGRRQRAVASRLGRRKLTLTLRPGRRANQAQVIALDRAGRYSAVRRVSLKP